MILESIILKNKENKLEIAELFDKKWMPKDKKVKDIKLLFRASRDGWGW